MKKQTIPLHRRKQNMRIILVSLLLVNAFIAVQCFGNPLIGPGRWMIESVMQCPDSDQYRMLVDISRKKLNRTHDGFTLHLDTGGLEFNDGIAVTVDIYKKMDGGYKYYMQLEDESACNLVNKFAKTNFEIILGLIGIDPPVCLIPPGEYTATNFVFNYEELDDDYPYGTYECYSYLLLADELISCFKLNARFEQGEDDDD